MKLLNILAPTVFLGCTLVSAVHAQTLWSDNSLTLLRNTSDFAGPWLQNKDLTTVTLEHVSSHSWGDIFFFVDYSNGDGYSSRYGELVTRLSLAPLFEPPLKTSIVKDIYLAASIESSKHADNYMAGLSFDWNITGFNYLKTSFYQVNNENIENDQQLTVVYAVPFKIANVNFIIDGFVDWSSGQDDHAAELLFVPQIKLDLADIFNTPTKVEIGIEYSYWNNKFGINNLNERTLSAIIKLHL